jgi:hypothetical protein
MASREITGFLDLDQITPVIDALFGAFNLGETYSTAFDKFYVARIITALFGAFHLDASFPGHGQASIARTSGSKDPQWDDVRDDLARLSAELGLPDRTDDPSIADLLPALAAHFGVEQDEELDRLIRHGDFEGDLEVLFRLATRFDDGQPAKDAPRYKAIGNSMAVSSAKPLRTPAARFPMNCSELFLKSGHAGDSHFLWESPAPGRRLRGNP